MLKNYRMFFNFIIKFLYLFCRADEARKTQNVNQIHNEPVTSQDLPSYDTDSHIRNRFTPKISTAVCVLLCF